MALNESASNILISCYFDVTPLQDKTKVCIIEMVEVSIFVFNLLVIRCGRERKKKEEMTDIIICIIPLPPSEKTSQRIVHPMHTFS